MLSNLCLNFITASTFDILIEKNLINILKILLTYSVCRKEKVKCKNSNLKPLIVHVRIIRVIYEFNNQINLIAEIKYTYQMTTTWCSVI